MEEQDDLQSPHSNQTNTLVTRTNSTTSFMMDQISDETTQSLIEEISSKSFRGTSPTSYYHQNFLNQQQQQQYSHSMSQNGGSINSQVYFPSDSVSTNQTTTERRDSQASSTRQQHYNQQQEYLPINSKHFNVQCYRGNLSHEEATQSITSQPLIHPKSITIEWVFDDCITQRYIHKRLKKCIGVKQFSDVEFSFSYDYSNDEETIKRIPTTLTISESACFLIPSIACKIDEGKIQTIELQIPFCFHFAIDYPEDIPSLLTSYNQKVTMEGCVVFSSQVFVQIFEWCEHYSTQKEFMQIDLEGKGMMFCCNSESYFKSVIGEWNWDFLQSMDKNLLLQTLIMSHILSITPLLLMIKTKIMFDVRQKCKEAATNQPSHASTKIQFLNYFVQDPSRCHSLINSPTIHSSPIPHRRHARSSSYDKIRGLTSSSSSKSNRNSPAVASSSTSALLSNSPQKSSILEDKVLATLGDSEKGLIHFMRIR